MNHSPFSRQQGIAAILILVMLGLSLTAAMLGGVHYLRSSQEQHTTLHAQTIAQARAWTAAEALRGYFEILAQSDGEWDDFVDSLGALPATVNIDIDGVEAQLTAVDTNSESPLISAQFRAKAAMGSRAESGSIIEAVYQITRAEPPLDGDMPSDRSVIHFRNGLKITGDLKVLTAPDQNYEIVVDGNVDLGGLSVGGIDAIRSTGSIKFAGGSASDFQEMHANCDVDVSGGVFTVENVRATRNICLANTISSQSIAANGSVKIKGGKHGDIRASANKPAGVAQCATGADHLCDGLNQNFGVKTKPSPEIDNIYSKGNVAFESDVTVGRIQTEGDLAIIECTPNWSSAIYGGVFYDNRKCSRTATHSDRSVLLDPVPAVEVQAEVFDANTLRELANFIYSYVDGVARVKIQNVEGLRDSIDELNPEEVRRNGYYYRAANFLDPGNPGWTGRIAAGYACINNKTPSRKDETEPYCLALLGHANSFEQPLPKHFTDWNSTGWEFNGKNHAPGVIFAEGDVRIINGTYTNTFIATGNLHVTSAGGAVFALNYAGPDGITAESHTALGVCNNSVYSFRPREFCKNGYNAEAHSGIGNYGLLAGSCPPGSTNGCNKNAYTGGDIKVDRSVFGAVKAGNLFNSAADAKLYGFVSALAQRNNNSTTLNQMGASTTIDLTVSNELQERYDPAGGSTSPGGEDDSGDEGAENGEQTYGSAIILWSRYL